MKRFLRKLLAITCFVTMLITPTTAFATVTYNSYIEDGTGFKVKNYALDN